MSKALTKTFNLKLSLLCLKVSSWINCYLKKSFQLYHPNCTIFRVLFFCVDIQPFHRGLPPGYDNNTRQNITGPWRGVVKVERKNWCEPNRGEEKNNLFHKNARKSVSKRMWHFQSLLNCCLTQDTLPSAWEMNVLQAEGVNIWLESLSFIISSIRSVSSMLNYLIWCVFDTELKFRGKRKRQVMHFWYFWVILAT